MKSSLRLSSSLHYSINMSLCVPIKGYRGYLRIVSSPYPDFMDWVRKIHSLKRTTKEVRFLMTPTPEFRENSRERGARSPAYRSQRFDPPLPGYRLSPRKAGKCARARGGSRGWSGAWSAVGWSTRGGRQTAEPGQRAGPLGPQRGHVAAAAGLSQ